MYVFVNRIRSLLKEKGILAKTLLEDLEINKDQLKIWESKESIPKRIYIAAIAAYLETTPEYLLGLTDSKEIPAGINFSFTDSEVKLVEAYRNHPELQAAVNKLLEIDTSSEHPALSVRVAARSGSDYNVHGTDEDTDPVVR